jgi:hypothetical protein
VRFEVLQAAYYAFSQAGPTNQSLTMRCVLLELFAGTEGPENATVINASDSLLANTTRQSMAFVRYPANETAPTGPAGGVVDAYRFAEYYAGALVPTAIFDGTARDFAPGLGTEAHYWDLYNLSAAVAPGAAINATGSIAISYGNLRFEVFSPYNLSGSRVYLRAALVENNVTYSPGGRVFHHVLRASLGGYELALAGNSTVAGQFNFAVDSRWVESQLGVVLFVQSDGPRAVGPIGPPPGFDFLGAVILPLAVLVTGAVMVLVLSRSITSERKARLR